MFSIFLHGTNEASPEFLHSLDKSPFAEQQLAGFNEAALAIVNQQQAYKDAHPPIAQLRTLRSKTFAPQVIPRLARK